MDKTQILQSLGKKSNGEIYLGVVGAVRTGKSTFIKKCIETLILPYIEDDAEKNKKGFLSEMKEAYKNGDLGEEWGKILKLCGVKK